MDGAPGQVDLPAGVGVTGGLVRFCGAGVGAAGAGSFSHAGVAKSRCCQARPSFIAFSLFLLASTIEDHPALRSVPNERCLQGLWEYPASPLSLSERVVRFSQRARSCRTKFAIILSVAWTAER